MPGQSSSEDFEVLFLKLLEDAARRTEAENLRRAEAVDIFEDYKSEYDYLDEDTQRRRSRCLNMLLYASVAVFCLPLGVMFGIIFTVE